MKVSAALFTIIVVTDKPVAFPRRLIISLTAETKGALARPGATLTSTPLSSPRVPACVSTYVRVLSRTPETRYYWITFLIRPLFWPPAPPPTLSLSFSLQQSAVVSSPNPSLCARRRHRQVRPCGASSTFVFRMELLCRRFHLLYMRATNERIFAQVNRIMERLREQYMHFKSMPPFVCLRACACVMFRRGRLYRWILSYDLTVVVLSRNPFCVPYITTYIYIKYRRPSAYARYDDTYISNA